MRDADRFTRAARFGTFEADLQARELRRKGIKLKLQEKPFQILELLLERAGEVVAREDLHKRLWPRTHVGFDRSLNTAMNALRYVLRDSADNPRFVETCQRRGYRFIAPVEWIGDEYSSGGAETIGSLAVLPLRNDTGDPEMEYLCDGITESIINAISRLPDVRVMARATVFRYKGREIDPQKVGHELNVRAIVIGRVLQRGEDLGISMEAVDVSSGWQLWGEQFHRKAADLFALQDEISRDISARLRPRLSLEKSRYVTRQSSQSSEAYRDYLKGRYYLNRMNEDSLRRGILHFRQALQKDPAYAPAHAGLAACYGLFGFFSLQSPRAVMPLAKQAALRALEIDDGLAEAHASLAGVLKTFDWNWSAAEKEYKRALELNPNYATGHHLYADFLSALGRPQEAIREIQTALDLDPLSLVISNEVGWNLYMARQYDGALEHALKTLDMEPDFPAARHTLGLVYEQVRRFEEAIAAHMQARGISGENPASLAALGHACALAGNRDQARSILDEMQALARRTYVSGYQSAILHAGLGELDVAIAELRRAVEE
ncbi:MAG TPA: winged helix-turn-helix domain-containing protein, partial [Acidobacteriota bacterium]|nr:winged helix-turn-helix domain-containing protein [Acidobacteriota bacterium]